MNRNVQIPTIISYVSLNGFRFLQTTQYISNGIEIPISYTYQRFYIISYDCEGKGEENVFGFLQFEKETIWKNLKLPLGATFLFSISAPILSHTNGKVYLPEV